MKSKKFTYLLLVCVAGLWGLIFYRIFNSMSDKELPVLPSSPKKMAYFKMVNHEEDQVDLKLDYRNPFSASSVEFITDVPKTTSMPKAIVPINMHIKVPVKWNSILYTGYINNPTNKQKVAMLTLDGKEFMLTEGQQSNGVKLLKYAKDSIKLQYQNETRYIKLK
jgi:hypothetical protein